MIKQNNNIASSFDQFKLVGDHGGSIGKSLSQPRVSFVIDLSM